jgi:hypothetical protein
VPRHAGGERDVVQLAIGLDALQQQRAAAHVAAPDEVAREAQAVAEDVGNRLEVLRGRDAAEEDDPRTGLQAGHEVVQIAKKRAEVPRVARREIDADELAQQGAVDRQLGRLQAAGRGDHEHPGPVALGGEVARVGELAPEVEAADEAERGAERHRAGGELPGRRRRAPFLQQHRAALAAAERG